MIAVYGIKNCDTMKKTFQWLEKYHVKYEFHDYKKLGVDKTFLTNACKQLGWETLLNRRGTTWRKLPDKVKDNMNEKSALDVMVKQPSIIKRPLIIHKKQMIVGFDDSQLRQLLK